MRFSGNTEYSEGKSKGKLDTDWTGQNAQIFNLLFVSLQSSFCLAQKFQTKTKPTISFKIPMYEKVYRFHPSALLNTCRLNRIL